MTPASTSQTARPTPRPHAKPVRSRSGTRRSQPPEQALPPCVICPELDPALACDTCIANACERRQRGYDVAEIARVMQIDTDRVWLLLAALEAIAELEALKVDTVPTEGLRALIRAACYPANATFGARDDVERIEHGRMSDENLHSLAAMLRASTPRTLSAIAAELGYSHVGWLSRKVGAIPKPGPPGREKQYYETISVEEASNIVRVLGLAPVGRLAVERRPPPCVGVCG